MSIRRLVGVNDAPIGRLSAYQTPIERLSEADLGAYQAPIERDGRTGGRADRRAAEHGRTDERTNGQTDGRTVESG